jgi:3-polyprenyl-4-hydroxybenzoate decarboxylase
MRVITKQALITTAAERFREAHQRRGEWLPTADGGDAAAIYAKLTALPVDVKESDLTAAIGDNRWTENICDECGEDRDVTVILGEEIHHPTDMTAICPLCLKQARRIAEASS